MRIPWQAVAAGSVLLGAGIVFFARRERTPGAPKRIALIGDSYAVGLGPQLAKLFSDFRFEGHVGTNTAQWASSSPACANCGSWIAAFKPDTVLVSLGVNDATPNAADYRAIVQWLQDLGARVVWIQPPNGVKTDSIASVRAAIRSLGVNTVAPTYSPLAADGLHPTSYGPWAREAAHTIEPSISVFS